MSESSRPLRILHCLWKGEIGGAERAVYQLVREQLRNPALAPALLFAQDSGPYWEYANELACSVITLGLPHGHSVRRLSRVSRPMREYDVHHFHSPEPVLMLASLRCRDARRVYTHRGGLAEYSRKKWAQHAVAGFLLRRDFHAFSGNTAHAARCGAHLYRLPPELFQVTYNGLEAALLAPTRPAEAVRQELGLDTTDYVLGTAANLKPWKRIERLLQALATLSDPRLRLLVVGDGPDRDRLERLTAKLDLDARVMFAGLQLQVADYLQVMDAFSLPSTALESFGNAAVEAMFLGLPTIVFADGGGMVEHIRSGETGFVVGNQGELEATLRRLLAGPGWGRDIGSRGRDYVRERYTPAHSAQAYKALYASALGEPAGEGSKGRGR